jgi:hypothetical protein
VVARRAPPAAARLREGARSLPNSVVHDRRLLDARLPPLDPGPDRLPGATSTASGRCSPSPPRTSR